MVDGIKFAKAAVLGVLFRHAVSMPAESNILSGKELDISILIVDEKKANRLKLELACLSQFGAQLSRRL